MSEDEGWKSPFPRNQKEFLSELSKVLYSWPKKYEEMTDEEKEHAYNESAESLWKAAVLAFNYAANKAGASGFQAGYAALKIYGEIMRIDAPYAIITGDDLLYPQYDIRSKVEGYIRDWTDDWAKEEAKKKLKTSNPKSVAPRVWEHWEKLAKG